MGAGWIGMEATSSIALQYHRRTLEHTPLPYGVSDDQNRFPIHVVSSGSHPLGKVFGPEVGEMYTWRNSQYGVQMHMKTRAKKILKDDNGYVKGVELENGTCIKCSLVIVGQGSVP